MNCWYLCWQTQHRCFNDLRIVCGSHSRSIFQNSSFFFKKKIFFQKKEKKKKRKSSPFNCVWVLPLVFGCTIARSTAGGAVPARSTLPTTFFSLGALSLLLSSPSTMPGWMIRAVTFRVVLIVVVLEFGNGFFMNFFFNLILKVMFGSTTLLRSTCLSTWLIETFIRNPLKLFEFTKSDKNDCCFLSRQFLSKSQVRLEKVKLL